MQDQDILNKYMFSPPGIIGCGYFCPSRFSSEMCDVVKLLVPVTRILWQRTKVYERLASLLVAMVESNIDRICSILWGQMVT